MSLEDSILRVEILRIDKETNCGGPKLLLGCSQPEEVSCMIVLDAWILIFSSFAFLTPSIFL